MESMQDYLCNATRVVEEVLPHYMKNGEPLLEELHGSINYTLYSGGKRVRPLFCFIVGDLFAVPREKLLSLACALEMIHTASLIMDDLPHMDNAKIRRGKPANHLIYGQDVAALASIGLLTRAYEIVLSDSQLSDWVKAKIVAKLAGTVGIHGLVGGQFVDLKYSDRKMASTTLEYIHIHKTAELFVASGTTAAYIGNATDEEISALEEYARSLGFAFQVLDDILDSTGSEEEVGKTLQNDRGNHVALNGIEKSKRTLREYRDRAIAAIGMFEGRNHRLVALGEMLLNRRS